MTTMMIRLTRRIRGRYRRSWAGVSSAPSRGLVLLITVAIVAWMVVVRYTIDRNDADARGQIAVNTLEDQRRDCVRAALSGADLKATSMAGVKHAEDTVRVVQSSAGLWLGVADILEHANAASPAVQTIVAGVNQYAADASTYAADVAKFRVIAEQYSPRTIAECREIGDGVLEPLPANPTVPPPTRPGG